MKTIFLAMVWLAIVCKLKLIALVWWLTVVLYQYLPDHVMTALFSPLQWFDVATLQSSEISFTASSCRIGSVSRNALIPVITMHRLLYGDVYESSMVEICGKSAYITLYGKAAVAIDLNNHQTEYTTATKSRQRTTMFNIIALPVSEEVQSIGEPDLASLIADAERE
jgi:hypothetical protein